MDINNKRKEYYFDLNNIYITIIKQWKNDYIHIIKLLSDYEDIKYIL